MKRLITLALLFCSAQLSAQDDPDIVPVPVDNLPAGSRVVAYATVETEAATMLVTEIRTRDGTAAFTIFDYIDDALIARPIGPRSIPTDLSAPPIHRPVVHRTDAPGDRYWEVDVGALEDQNQQLISAPPLPELRFAEVGRSPWQLSPPPEHPLAIRQLTVAADRTVLDQCVLEPNITAAGDRMTTGGGWWVAPYGEPHLLVSVLHQGPGTAYRGGLRLYNPEREVVATATPVMDVDPNAVPDLVRADLSGDGEQEMIFFATTDEPDAAFFVYRFDRRDGRRRVVAFNLCSVRMNGADVSRLQRALEGRGYSVGRHGIDGWYGPDTRAAVIRFQRDADLPVTGVVDEPLWQLLGLD